MESYSDCQCIIFYTSIYNPLIFSNVLDFKFFHLCLSDLLLYVLFYIKVIFTTGPFFY